MIKYILGYNVRANKRVCDAWSRLWLHKVPNMIFRFSTSIQNFADRVRNQNDVYEWSWRSLFEPTVFLGLYHEGDWLRILLHRGPKLAFWCGGDILRLQAKPLWQKLLKRAKIDHVCENEVEQKALKKMGIKARIHPILFFDDVNKYKVTFKPSKSPHVWVTSHQGREKEYGVELIQEIANEVPEVTFHIFGSTKPGFSGVISFDPINGEAMNLRFQFQPNIKYYGWIPTEKVDEIIKKCQAGFRGNEFDGCPHSVTKGILHGQYPINRIPYPYTDSYKTKEELVKLLKNLKNKKKPNLAGRKHWLPILTEFPWS